MHCIKTTELKSFFSENVYLRDWDIEAKGIKKVLVIRTGYASDCVETLEEINIQGRESFLSQGGDNFDLIPCLNDNSDHINLFEKLVTKYI